MQGIPNSPTPLLVTRMQLHNLELNIYATYQMGWTRLS